MFKPFGNETTVPPAQWHSEPNFRGTYTVLSTCVFTMVLCVWTSVHLNLPEHKQERKQTLRKLGWLVMGLLAPEMVAWNAWEQRREVKRLTKEMREHYRKRNRLPPRKRPTSPQAANIRSTREHTTSWWRGISPLPWLRRFWHKVNVSLLLEAGELNDDPKGKWPVKSDEEVAAAAWTDVHSWYAIMGGFAFDTTSSERPILPDGRERLTLTPEGIVTLAMYWPTLLPEISRQDIEDKSKSDALAKFITCWQATWFCVQCITRLAQGLSISLLELNVFGHAICALLIYSIWWDKPKDIQEPTKMVGDEYNSVAAVMCTFSDIGKPAITGIDKVFEVDRSILRWSRAEANRDAHVLPASLPVAVYKLADISGEDTLMIGDGFWQVVHLYRESMTEDEGSKNVISVDKCTASRLQTIRHFDEMESIAKDDMRIYDMIDFLRPRNPNWSISRNFLDMELDTAVWFRYFVGVTVASGLYGGLHVTAWNYLFSSNTETLLWRTASLTVTLGDVLLLIFGFGGVLVDLCDDGKSEYPVKIFVLVLASGAVLWYCFCRAFLVVESFICLAHLPAAALEVPSWSKYAPHVT